MSKIKSAEQFYKDWFGIDRTDEPDEDTVKEREVVWEMMNAYHAQFQKKHRDKKEIPAIEIKDGELIISITAEELRCVVEKRPDEAYTVLDQNMFLNHFAANLETYQESNSRELGCTELQALFDEIIDQTYEGGSEAIISKAD